MNDSIKTSPKPQYAVLYGAESLKDKIRNLLKFMGPAFVVSVAYIDPGNFAANISGGSYFGYSLLWVILLSNLMAIFLQIMSAKLGIATGRSLSEMCRDVFPKSANWFFYIVATAAAMATTLAEFIGGALGFYLLFGIPLVWSAFLTAAVTFGIVYLQKYGQKAVERVITALIAVICAAYAIELFLSKPDWGQVALHTLFPSIPDKRAMLIAVSMLGATVMPHVIYLHSQLVQCRNRGAQGEDRKKHLRMEKIDIAVAMNIAFVVNAAMVVVSAAVFYSRGVAADSIELAHRSLEPLLGRLSSGAFGAALLASGFSSSSVGAMAGESIMDGFVDFKLPLNARRIITMLPGLAVILCGVNPMEALVLSQAGLSFALPAAIVPMLIITGKREYMGEFVNKKWVRLLGAVIVSVIVLFNAALLHFTFSGVM